MLVLRSCDCLCIVRLCNNGHDRLDSTTTSVSLVTTTSTTDSTMTNVYNFTSTLVRCITSISPAYLTSTSIKTATSTTTQTLAFALWGSPLANDVEWPANSPFKVDADGSKEIPIAILQGPSHTTKMPPGCLIPMATLCVEGAVVTPSYYCAN